MPTERRSHDINLLDALDELEGIEQRLTVYRAVIDGRSELDMSRGAGRWNPRSLSVLYTALEENGAIAEIHHHLSVGQPVVPTKLQFNLVEMRVTFENCVDLSNMEQLTDLGVEEARYKEMLYSRTQEIGAAVDFLGFDGLVIPSARWNCSNAVLLSGFNFENAEVVSERPIDLKQWISDFKS